MHNDYSRLPEKEIAALRALLYNQQARPAPKRAVLKRKAAPRHPRNDIRGDSCRLSNRLNLTRLTMGKSHRSL